MCNAELIAEARDVLGRVNTNAIYHDSLFQYRGGVLVRELTLIVRDLADALEANEARVKELEAQAKDHKAEQIFRISELQELGEAQARIAELEAGGWVPVEGESE